MSTGGKESGARYDFTGRVALVTGAAGDLGRAAAIRLATTGAALVLSDLESASAGLAGTQAACEGAGAATVLVASADVTEEAQVDAMVAAAVDAVGPVDMLFNNAGYQGAFAPTPDHPLADLRRVTDVNLIGVAIVLQAVARIMRDAGRAGSIVNTASMASDGPPNMLAYAASKGGVVSLTRTAARDLAPHGIRVNAISPAFIGPGAMWDRQVELQASADGWYYANDPETVAEQMIAQVPLHRYGSPEEVAAVVVWLLSPDASYVTGHNIAVSGGI